MAELEDINGVGPARSESLKEAGYESPEDLVDADPEEVADAAEISEDNALETIVQAQNIVEESEDQDEGEEPEPASEPEEADTISEEIDQELDAEPREANEEVEESEGESEEEDESLVGGDDGETVEEGVDEAAVEEAEAEEAEDGPFDITLDFDSREHFDVFHHALVEHWQDSYDTRVDSSTMRELLDGIDNFESTEMTLTREELNNLHSALHQERISYQGSNQVEQLNLLRDIEQEINEVRQEKLF